MQYKYDYCANDITIKDLDVYFHSALNFITHMEYGAFIFYPLYDLQINFLEVVHVSNL